MHNEFTSVIEQDGEWFIGYCPEIPGANGQGRTVKEFRANLSEAIALILEDRRSFRPGGREDGIGKDRMAQREPRTIVISSTEELLRAARRRANLPPGQLWLDYQDDWIRSTSASKRKRNLLAARAISTMESSSIMKEKNWSELEIMDITGQLKYANPS